MQDAGEVPVLRLVCPPWGRPSGWQGLGRPLAVAEGFTGRWSDGSSLAWVGAAGSC